MKKYPKIVTYLVGALFLIGASAFSTAQALEAAEGTLPSFDQAVEALEGSGILGFRARVERAGHWKGRLRVFEVGSDDVGAAAGLRVDDVITQVAGRTINYENEIDFGLDFIGIREGDRVVLTVQRDGQPHLIAVEARARTADEQEAMRTWFRKAEAFMDDGERREATFGTVDRFRETGVDVAFTRKPDGQLVISAKGLSIPERFDPTLIPLVDVYVEALPRGETLILRFSGDERRVDIEAVKVPEGMDLGKLEYERAEKG